jgi:hypothetical protein
MLHILFLPTEALDWPVERGCARAPCGGGIMASTAYEADCVRCRGGFARGVRTVIEIFGT